MGAKLFREQVKALTDDRGADVIYDPVGGANHLLIKDAEAIGFTIGGLSRLDPARKRKNLAILMGWLAARRTTPHVFHRLPLEQAAEALKLVRDRKVIGKAVLV